MSQLDDDLTAARAHALSALSLSAEQWDALPLDEQMTLLAGLIDGGASEVTA